MNYDKKEQIGVGSLGPVFLGRDKELARDVAIRELAQNVVAEAELAERYLARMRRFAVVSHPNVLTIHAVESGSAPPRVVMEHMKEGTLRGRMARGPTSPEETASLLRQVLQGLRELHRRGLVHGDVKPENLFCSGGSVKIGDFGRAALTSGEERPAGAARYAAPEVLRSEAEPKPAADLYALGLVTYELALGPERFRRVIADQLRGLPGGDHTLGSGGLAEADRLWIRLHLSAAALPPLHEVDPTLPKELSDVVARLLRKDAETRYQDCAEPLNALGDLRSWTAMLAAVDASQKVSEEPEAVEDDPFAWITPRVVGVVAAGLALTLAVSLVLPRIRGWDSGSPPSSPPPSSPAPSSPAPPSPFPPSQATPEALLDQLGGWLSSEDDITLQLAGGGPPRITVGEPLSFRVSSRRDTHIVVFVTTSDGTLSCLYPNLQRPSGLRIAAGSSETLPLPEDAAAGFEVRTAAPLGRDAAFVLGSVEPLQPPPGPPDRRALGRWLPVYPLRLHDPSSPAMAFVRWVGEIRKARPATTRLVTVEYEVLAAAPR